MHWECYELHQQNYLKTGCDSFSVCFYSDYRYCRPNYGRKRSSLVSEGQDYDFDSETYSDYEAQDWEECCEEQYESFLDDSDYEDGYDTAILSISPMTGYFVLILIFSVLCMICAIIPFDVRYKVPTVTLFGLATTVSGIFLARKSAVTLGIYLSELSNSGGRELGSHAHVMIYLWCFLSMVCLLLGSLIIASVKDLLSQDSKVSTRFIKDRLKSFFQYH